MLLCWQGKKSAINYECLELLFFSCVHDEDDRETVRHSQVRSPGVGMGIYRTIDCILATTIYNSKCSYGDGDGAEQTFPPVIGTDGRSA